MKLHIRKATLTDVGCINRIFRHARLFMKANHNPNQWINGYPDQDQICKDIEASHCYVVTDESAGIVATFCFIPGPDPTYTIIEDGKWISNQPYYVIHRIASDGTIPGITQHCLEWCFHTCPHLRVDTHKDNTIMRHILEKNGFTRCGIIYVKNGTARIAYEKA